MISVKNSKVSPQNVYKEFTHKMQQKLTFLLELLQTRTVRWGWSKKIEKKSYPFKVSYPFKIILITLKKLKLKFLSRFNSSGFFYRKRKSCRLHVPPLKRYQFDSYQGVFRDGVFRNTDRIPQKWQQHAYVEKLLTYRTLFMAKRWLCARQTQWHQWTFCPSAHWGLRWSRALTSDFEM